MVWEKWLDTKKTTSYYHLSLYSYYPVGYEIKESIQIKKRNKFTIKIINTVTKIKKNGFIMEKTINKKSASFSILLALVLLISACSGGSSNGNNNDDPESSDLSNLVLSSGALTPAFSSTVYDYTAESGKLTNAITMVATAENSNAVIQINGAGTASGSKSSPISITSGGIEITIDVSLPGTQKTSQYKITVTKATTAMKTEITLPVAGAADNDNFGMKVDTYGNTVIASFPKADYGGITDAGSVYVYEKTNGNWELNTILESPVTDEDDGFGNSIAIYEDTIVVSAQFNDVSGDNSAGCIYVFTKNSQTWSLSSIVTAANPVPTGNLGVSVDIHDNAIIAGSRHSINGAVHFFRKTSGSAWEQREMFEGESYVELMGASVKLYGNYAIVGAPNHTSNLQLNKGKIYVFHNDNGTWTKASMEIPSYINENDHYGVSVSISNNHIVSGAFKKDNGSNFHGAASVYERTDTFLWDTTTRKDLYPSSSVSENWFGTSVDLNGNTLVVGCPNGAGVSNGRVYLYKSGTDNNWNYEETITGATVADHEDSFGQSVAISDTYLVVGAPNYDHYDNGGITKSNIGAIFIYE